MFKYHDIFLKLKETLNNSYAPYSKFHTAALVETDKGTFYGVNIENAAYSPTICAERNAIFSAIANGAKKFKLLCFISSSKRTDIVPCGVCRQVMDEFFDRNTKIIAFNILGKYKEYTLKQLSPYCFNKQNLGSK